MNITGKINGIDSYRPCTIRAGYTVTALRARYRAPKGDGKQSNSQNAEIQAPNSKKNFLGHTSKKQQYFRKYRLPNKIKKNSTKFLAFISELLGKTRTINFI